MNAVRVLKQTRDPVTRGWTAPKVQLVSTAEDFEFDVGAQERLIIEEAPAAEVEHD